MPLWLKQKLWMREHIRDELGYEGSVLFTEHHESHAASAFSPSPFENAAILTMDGVGEWATSSIGMGEGNNIRLLKEIHFPHSLGLLYFRVHVLHGIQGEQRRVQTDGAGAVWRAQVRRHDPRRVHRHSRRRVVQTQHGVLDYCVGLRMTNRRFAQLVGGPARKPESKLTQREMDLAASVQVVTEQVMLGLVIVLSANSALAPFIYTTF